MFRIKIKVSWTYESILWIRLPDAVFKLDNGITDHKSYGYVDLYGHLVLKAKKNLTTLGSLRITKFARKSTQVYKIRLPINPNFIEILCIPFSISWKCQHHLYLLLLYVMKVKVNCIALRWRILKDILTIGLLLYGLVMSDCRLKPNNCVWGWS